MKLDASLSTSGELKVTISGKVGIEESLVIRKKRENFDFTPVNSVVLDFSGMDYLTSSGLRELLILKKLLHEKPLTIIGVHGVIREILDTSGFSAMIDCRSGEAPLNFTRMSFRDFLNYKVLHSGSRVIVDDGCTACTWAQLDRAASALAARMQRDGVKKESHVAICGANSIQWMEAFFAVQKLGAIAVFMNYKAELPQIIDLCGYTDVTHFCYGKILSAADTGAFLKDLTSGSCGVRFIYDMNGDDIFRTEPELFRQPDYEVTNNDVALMIFTSGSTGRPKAVMLSPYDVFLAASQVAESIRLSPQDVDCMVSPLFHISGFGGGMITDMIADAKIFLLSSTKTEVILNTIEAQHCTIFNCVPTVMLSLIHHPLFTKEKLKTLRYSKLAGAPLTEAQFLEITSLLTNVHLASSYGMTEAAPISCTDYEDTLEHIIGSVGRPDPNIEVGIFQPHSSERCADGETGEICARGMNVLTAYYKLDVKDQPIDEQGWLHTGDLGFLAPDGYLHFSGRLKNLIIRGGENISPGEICAVLTEADDVADARAFGIPDPLMGELVGAAILLRPNANADEASLRAFAEARLAKYKWPVRYVFYEEFPILSNGKVDEIGLKKDFLAKAEVQL